VTAFWISSAVWLAVLLGTLGVAAWLVVRPEWWALAGAVIGDLLAVILIISAAVYLYQLGEVPS
jgi:hypothetical protein